MVGMKRIARCGMAVALLCGAGGLVAQVSTPGTVSPVRSLVSRYVTALQRRDYKTIVELNEGIKGHEFVIMHDNPKFLWPKLIADYRERRVRELKGEDVKPIDMDDLGDFKRKEINEQLSLLPPECKWAIAELRPGIDLVGHRYTDIFVTVTYPAREAAPKNEEGNPLQRAILKFFVISLDTTAVEYFGRVTTGDVPWKILPE
jgi:hypothetical protein